MAQAEEAWLEQKAKSDNAEREARSGPEKVPAIERITANAKIESGKSVMETHLLNKGQSLAQVLGNSGNMGPRDVVSLLVA